MLIQPQRVWQVLRRSALTAMAVVGQVACGALRPASVPMRTVPYGTPTSTDRFLLLLPGRHDSAGDFGRYGFVEEARAAGLSAEVVAAEAHMGYYVRRVIHTRLREDVLAPTRARGLRTIWMMGISLGALGSVIVGSEFPGELDGLILVAPYLGPDALIREIESAGGLRNWSPPAEPEDFAGLWVWLRGYADSPSLRPPLILAYGENDRYGKAHGLLAEVLPADRVLTEPGGHDWSTWKRLWKRTVRHPIVRGALGGAASPEPTSR